MADVRRSNSLRVALAESACVGAQTQRVGTQPMPDYARGPEKPTDESGIEELDKRDVRALTQCMTVIPEGGDLFSVTSESGRSYTVDLREGRCTCPDSKHNLPTDDGRETCKHHARVAFATGERTIPAWADGDAVDPLLGDHVDGGPTRAVADGGSDMIVASDEGEIVDGDGDDGRPDSCECIDFNTDVDLPCWPCFRAGFESPATADDDGGRRPRRSEPADFGAGDSTGVQDL